METIKKDSALWKYLDVDLRGLVEDGEFLLDHLTTNENAKISDYSYLVFPFAKAYEGFLKRFFLDMDLISEKDYYSDSIRIGRILNPMFIKKKYSVYAKLKGGAGGNKDIARRLWGIWKRGRNLVFHYFPHNFRKLTYRQALEIIEELVSSMSDAVFACSL